MLPAAGVGVLAFTTAACGGRPGVDGGVAAADAISGGRELFVSASGSDTADGSLAHPLRTLQKAANLTMPGDVVSVLDGTYTNPSPGNGAVINITRSGRAGAWITYRAYPGHHPRLKFDGWNGVSLHGGVSYVEITGFEVEGNINAVSLDYCTSQQTIANPACNGNGISVDGRKDGAQMPHHLRIANNEIHHCAGGGASAISADYVTIEGNVIHDNSWYTQYATSGISILTPWGSDQSTGYKMFVRGNKLWNNKTLVKWTAKNKFSDGNGIIIDTFISSAGSKNPNGDYRGRTLVTNNVSIENGGSGIHSFSSAHVDIVNNSAYMNGQVVGYSDIFAAYSEDVNVLNNVMYARADGQVNSDSQNTNVRYDYNVYFNGKAPAVVGPHDVIADPLFVDAASGDLRVAAGSPAIDRGTANLAPAVDFLGTARPQGAGFDIGAYELAAGGATPPGGPSTDFFEAEYAAVYGGAVSNTIPGFTGTGFFDFHGWAAATVTWSVPRAAAGSFDLVFRYGNGSASPRPLRVLVNGVEISAGLAFPPGAWWGQWQTVTIAADLQAGDNTIEVLAGPDSGPNLDSLRTVAR